MRAYLAVLLAAVPLAAGPQAAIAQPAPVTETRISLNCRDVPLREAIQAVAGAGRFSFFISREVGELPISLQIQNVPSATALRTLVKLAGSQLKEVSLNRRGDFYTIYRRLAEVDPDFVPLPPLVVGREPGARTATASFINMPVGDALTRLLGGSGIRYRLVPPRPAAQVNLFLRDVPLADVIESVPRVLPGSTVRLVEGVYEIRVPGASLAPVRPQVPDNEGIVRADVGEKVSLTTRDAPFRTVIHQVFAGSGLQYAIDPAVPVVRLTMSLRDVPRASALRTIMKLAAAQAERMVMEMEGDVYVFRLKPD